MPIDRRQLTLLIPALRRHARGLAGDAATADDLVQDSLVLALEREHQYRGGSLAAWMFAILTNAGRSGLRSRRRTPAAEPVGDLADGEGTDPALRIAILAGLASLPLEQKEALLLSAVEGFTYQETAEMTGVPVGTVMSRIARARDALAARLEGAAVVPIRRLK
jgi:RNA polymerase sigma-70 factor (ECF subfamily)